MPRNPNVGPRWFPSPVWLCETTSRMTSMPALLKAFDHRLEFGDLLSATPATGVTRVRGEEADRVVTPVVGQPEVNESGVRR